MKKTALLLLAVVALIFFTGTVSAEENLTEQILQETLKTVQNLPQDGFDFAQTAEQAAEGELSFTLSGVLSGFLDRLFAEIKDNAQLIVKMLVLSILAGVLCNLQQSMPLAEIAEISFLFCLSAIAGIAASVVADMVELAISTIDALMLFMQSLIPTMGSLAVSAGVGTAMGFYPTLFASMQVFIHLSKSFFMPLIMMITALSVVNAMSNRFHIGRLIDFARQTVKWGIGLLLTVFVGILSIRGFTAGAFGVAGRTVKYALCNFVPLVGGVLAESIEAVLSSVRIIRGAVGVAGVLAALSMCIGPVINMLAVSVLYRFTAGVAEPATDKRIVKLLVDLSGNITLILSIVLMVCVMFIISVSMLCLLI